MLENVPVVREFDPFDGMPAKFFAWARRERPVFFHERLNAYFLTRYSDCERVLKDGGEYISAAPALRPNVNPIPEAMAILAESGFVPAPSIVDEDGSEHRLHRAVAQPPFKAGNVRELASFIKGQVDARLSAIVALGETDLVDTVIYEVPAAVILHMMGIPDEQMGMIKGFRGPWSIFLWGLPDSDVQLATAKGMAEFGRWARAVAQRSLENPGDDIISEAIKNLKSKGALESSRYWLDSYTLNVVMAGHETTTNTMAGGVLTLLEKRGQWEALCSDADLIPGAVEEILRYSTGVPTWRQQVVKDIELSGITVPAGSLVYVALNSANRDEAVFGDDSERFDIRRKNANEHLAFGQGAHTCMGNHLAKLEMAIMLEEFSRRLPHMALRPNQAFTFSPNTTQRGPEQIFVRWDAAANPDTADRPNVPLAPI